VDVDVGGETDVFLKEATDKSNIHFEWDTFENMKKFYSTYVDIKTPTFGVKYRKDVECSCLKFVKKKFCGDIYAFLTRFNLLGICNNCILKNNTKRGRRKK
jgi:hypothetical protein